METIISKAMGLQRAQKQQCLLQISTWRRLKQTQSYKVTPSQENGSVTLMTFSPFGTVREKTWNFY